jgi:hypothetical protein
MDSKFSESMPRGKREEEVKDDLVVFGWKQFFKSKDSTLQVEWRLSARSPTETKILKRT